MLYPFSLNLNRNACFFGVLVLWAIIFFARIVFILDTDYIYRFSPYDDGLYIYIAESINKYGTLGDYFHHPLLKLPGFPLFILLLKKVSLPYMLTVNLLYLISVGCFGYYAYQLTKSRWVLFGGFMLALLNPIPISSDWFFIMREPISSIADLLMLALSFAIVKNGLNKKSLLHLIVLGFVFLFTQFLREEDIVRWIYLVVFVFFLIYQNGFQKKIVKWVLCWLLIIFTLQQSIDFGYKTYVNKLYGLPIKHEISEGELPKFLSSLRSISSGSENRLATIKWDTLSKLSLSVPEFKTLYDSLPIPSTNSISCNKLGVCKNWSYGHLVFWILSATSDSGVAPNLIEAQKFYRLLNDKIHEKCMHKEFICNPGNDKLIPSFNIKWTRAFFHEAKENLRAMFFPSTAGYESVAMSAPSYDISSGYIEMLGSSRNIWIQKNYGESLSKVRLSMVPILRLLFAPLLVVSVLLLIIKPFYLPGFTLTPLYIVSISYLIYSLTRLFVLAYIAIYMGGYEDRMFFTSYIGILSLSIYVIKDWITSKDMYEAR